MQPVWTTAKISHPDKKSLHAQNQKPGLPDGLMAIPEPINHNKCLQKWRDRNQARWRLYGKCVIARNPGFVPNRRLGEDTVRKQGGLARSGRDEAGMGQESRAGD